MKLYLSILSFAVLSACQVKAEMPLHAIDCTSFDSQEAAQKFYENYFEHWVSLDPLNTGVACVGVAFLQQQP